MLEKVITKLVMISLVLVFGVYAIANSYVNTDIEEFLYNNTSGYREIPIITKETRNIDFHLYVALDNNREEVMYIQHANQKSNKEYTIEYLCLVAGRTYVPFYEKTFIQGEETIEIIPMDQCESEKVKYSLEIVQSDTLLSMVVKEYINLIMNPDVIENYDNWIDNDKD